jgi:hypothetical protein
MNDNVIKFPETPLIRDLKKNIADGHMTWQRAFDFLQSHGMYARVAKRLLGPSGDEVDSAEQIG